MNILNFFLFILIFLLVFKYLSKSSHVNLLWVLLLGILIFCVLNILSSHKYENMTVTNPIIRGSCEDPCRIPRPYMLNKGEEDYINTGLKYNYDYPNQQFFKRGLQRNNYLTNKKIKKILEEQRYNKNISDSNYYLANDGLYSDGIPYNKVKCLIQSSKLHDLYNQHNHNITSSPHTHFGKNRGYLNWNGIFP